MPRMGVFVEAAYAIAIAADHMDELIKLQVGDVGELNKYVPLRAGITFR